MLLPIRPMLQLHHPASTPAIVIHPKNPHGETLIPRPRISIKTKLLRLLPGPVSVIGP